MKGQLFAAVPLPPFNLPSPALRASLTAAFLWAGIAKVRGPHLFATDIASFRLLPGEPAAGLTLAVAYYLPWLEIFCALGIWAPRWRPAALMIGGALLTVFTLALVSAWARGIHLDCGCFGGGKETNLPGAIGRNLLLLGFCVALWRVERSNKAKRG